MWSVSVPASVFSVIAEIFTSGWVSKVKEVRTVHWLTLGQLLISGDFFKSLVVVPSTAFSSSCIPHATTYFHFETLHDSWLTTCDVNIFSLFLPSSRFKRVLLRSPKGLYMLKSQEPPRIQLANKKNAKGNLFSTDCKIQIISVMCIWLCPHYGPYHLPHVCLLPWLLFSFHDLIRSAQCQPSEIQRASTYKRDNSKLSFFPSFGDRL